MGEVTIRELEPERDAAAVVALSREANPLAVLSPGSWLHRMRTVPDRAGQRLWGAELDGRIVGYAFACRNFFTEGSTSAFGGVTVGGAHRRRGIGAALHERVATHADALGASAVSLHFFESDAGVAFAKRLGYREARAESEAVLDPRTVAERPPKDIDLRRVRDCDPRHVFEVDLAATRDVPLLEPVDHVPYVEWEEHVLRHPLFEHDGSFVAYVADEPAAVSLLIVDRESCRAANMFTGTLRPYRGRGLALAVKLASIEWAAANGVTGMATTNDERNAPMLAINRRLGYRPVGRRVDYLREGTASSPAPPALAP